MGYNAFEDWRRRPNGRSPELSVVIPTYNEESRIVPTIGAMAAHLSAGGYTWELIVSDDGSTDGTVDKVRALGLANLHMVTSGSNRGKGHAVRQGMLAASGRYVLFADADNSTPIAEVDRMLEAMIGHRCDVAVGSRSVEGASVANRSLTRDGLSRGFQWLVSRLVRVEVQDTQCGFKLFTRGAARNLFSMQRLDGFAFDLEVLHLAGREGLTIEEFPVAWFDAPDSKVNPFTEPFRFLVDVVKIMRLELTGAYRTAPWTTIDPVPELAVRVPA